MNYFKYVQTFIGHQIKIVRIVAHRQTHAAAFTTPTLGEAANSRCKR